MLICKYCEWDVYVEKERQCMKGEYSGLGSLTKQLSTGERKISKKNLRRNKQLIAGDPNSFLSKFISYYKH